MSDTVSFEEQSGDDGGEGGGDFEEQSVDDASVLITAAGSFEQAEQVAAEAENRINAIRERLEKSLE